MEDALDTARKHWNELMKQLWWVPKIGVFELQDKDPNKYSTMTAREKKFLELQGIECQVVCIKITFMEAEDSKTEDNKTEDNAGLGEVRANEIAIMWQSYAKLVETLSVRQAQFEGDLPR